MSALRAGLIMLIAATGVTIGCMSDSGALTGLGIASGGGGGGGEGASSRLAFLVQPNNVTVGSPISPEVKVIALDTLDRVLGDFNGRVSLTLGSSVSGGNLSGTTRVVASGGLAIFDTLRISQAGAGFTLLASAPGLVSVSSAPFTVFAP